MRLPALCVCLLLFAPVTAAAQIFLSGSSNSSVATAVTPFGCNITDNLPGSTEASAECSINGYAALGSARSSVSASTSGGSVFGFGQSSATVPGSASGFTSSALGNGGAIITWQLFQTTAHYSLLTSTLGDATAKLVDGAQVDFPASGILPAGFYTLRADAYTSAIADDDDGAGTVSDGPDQAMGEVTLAEVGSTTLIRGTVTSADGESRRNLLVRASQGGVVVGITRTGDDGSYILDGLPGTVTIDVIDENGEFVTPESGPLAPPQTFDPVVSSVVPMLPAPLFGVLVLAFIAVAAHSLRRA